MNLRGGLSDKKQYRVVTLGNGLECLLIHEEVDEDAPTEEGSNGSGSASEGGGIKKQHI